MCLIFHPTLVPILILVGVFIIFVVNLVLTLVVILIFFILLVVHTDLVVQLMPRMDAIRILHATKA